MAASAAPPSLLPPYVPSPAFSSSFHTSPLLRHDDTSTSAMSPSLHDSLGTAWSTSTADVSTPRASTSSASTRGAPPAAFGRTRSHSLRPPQQPAPSSLDGSFVAGPSTPTSFSASSVGSSDYLSSSVQSSASTAPSSVSSAASSTVELPFIKMVTVPHYSGSSKHCMFACRVVPDLEVLSVPSTSSSSGMAPSRRENLGKMRIAGSGEPHTVWRSWQECLDFSACLSAAFADGRPEHKVPRLHGSNKLTNLFKSSTVGDRLVALETFLAHLFAMPPSVRHSPLVRHFFCIRPHDSARQDSSAVASSSPATAHVEPASAVPASVPDWLVAGDLEDGLSAGQSSSSPEATIKVPRQRPVRPTLAIKTSSPELRGTVRGIAGGVELFAPSPLSTRSAVPRCGDLAIASTATPDREAFGATATSSRTITPQPPSRPTTPSSGGGGFAKTLRKKASGGLRHIRSLGDLRGGSKKVETPDEPVPTLSPDMLAAAVSSIAMDRAASQPLVSNRPAVTAPPMSASLSAGGLTPSPSPSPSSATGPMGRLPPMPHSAPLNSRHRRNGSSKSSVTSFEDLWGSPFPTTFRQTTSGRLECVRDGPRRPSLSASAARPPPVPQQQQQYPARPPMYRGGHKASSASISSIDSARSGGSSGSVRSLAMSVSRSSAGSELCPTPPTPLSEWNGAAGDKVVGERVVAGKFWVENGVLHENNRVPPPPFFPVPPPMQFAYSHDGLPHTPRTSASSSRATHARRSSVDPAYPPTPRSRTGSVASGRRVPLHPQTSLDAILASPTPSSTASSPRTVGGTRTAWTFKLLHDTENVVLRVAKPADASSLSLERLRRDIAVKFKASGVDLATAGEWGLAWTTREPGGGASGTKLVVGQEDLDECLRAHDEATAPSSKIILKVIC
ncbi:hypothetical protein JCM8208_003481 [Rhodotorula glutinis]